MILDLKSIFANEGKTLNIEHSIDMSDVEFSGSYPLVSPVKAKGSISNRAGVVLLKLDMEYEFSAPCDRCGTDTSRKHTLTLERVLATSIEGEESDTIITVPDMKFDVDELIFSEVYLSLPTKHLCSETCKGYCFKCGKNLNEGSCDCESGGKEIDPRLSKLYDLLN